MKTLIGSLVVLAGLAVPGLALAVPMPATSVPTLSEWGMIGAAAALGAGALWKLRHRK
jgi:hypothetical protein